MKVKYTKACLEVETKLKTTKQSDHGLLGYVTSLMDKMFKPYTERICAMQLVLQGDIYSELELLSKQLAELHGDGEVW